MRIGSISIITPLLLMSVVVSALAPGIASAEELEVAGWVPYWASTRGTSDAKKHIEDLDVIHPFGFTVKQDGSLHDPMGLRKRGWRTLFKAADKENVLVIPTVTSGDGALVHRILSDSTKRQEHIEAIVEAVEKGKFDGIDIDYEGKRAETKEYFSLFLKELKEELDDKLLTCAIEARTPPDSLYREVPAVINYSNDYAAIGTYCDRIEIMTYDQQRADLKLNQARIGEPYIPLADIEWVRKVAELAVTLLPREKIMLGVPTYGHEYQITTAPDWYRDYMRIGALNPPAALKIAKKEKIIPSRNRAGELVLTYTVKGSPRILKSSSLSIPDDTASGNVIAARALAYANETQSDVIFRYVTWSDAEAIRQKVELARELGLRGVAIFKIDGQEDKGLWDVLEEEN